MTYSPDVLRARIQAALSNSPFDATALARQLNRGPDYVRDFLNGRKASLKPQELLELEHFLAVPLGHFFSPEDRSSSAVSEHTESVKSKKTTKETRIERGQNGDRLLMPVHSMEERERGIFFLSGEAVDFIPRPWFMKLVRSGYAVLIAEENMEPVLELGEMAIVNPMLPLVKNRNVILQSEKSPDAVRVTLLRLLSWDQDMWYVRQFHEAADFGLSRRDWPTAHRVIARLEA